MPASPGDARARLMLLRRAWETFDHDAMVKHLMETIEYVDFDTCPSYRPPRGLKNRHRELAPAEWPENSAE